MSVPKGFIKGLTKEEVKALAMHEIMVREQNKLHARIQAQRKIGQLHDDDLKELAYNPPKKEKP